jgi:hypothetical protein
VGGLVFLAIVCCIPLWVRTISSVRNRLAVEVGGATFAGRYRSWQVSALTGQVAGTNTYSTSSTQPTYGTVQTDYGPKSVVTGIRTSTSVHTTLLLVDKMGQQHSCTLTNFGLEVFNGQIVSVCSATRGRKGVVFAVLNHSSRRQSTPHRNLHKILYPHGQVLGFWLAGWMLLAIPVSLVLSFAGFFVFIAIVLISAFISSRATKRQIKGFENSGIGPLWASTAAVVATP